MYEPKGGMYTNQTVKFPCRSIQVNRYQMILREIGGNSTWIEPIKNKTEGGLILDRRRSLEQMKAQGVVPNHQVLYN